MNKINRTRNSGFSLIEVMIVVVIIAVLAGVAYPAYQDSIRKSNRTDAKESLSRIAALQERYFFGNNSYGDLTQIGMAADPYITPEGHYSVVVDLPSSCEVTDSSGTVIGHSCFKATATATGTQLKDLKCRKLEIKHTGKKSSQDSTNNPSDDCW